MNIKKPMPKPLFWVGSSKRDYAVFPDKVQDDMGFALHMAQLGEMNDDAKPLKGFGGAGIIEIVESHKGNAYRAVYTVWFSEAVYVLHAFQKKSHKGIQTDPNDIELVRKRLKRAEEMHKQKLEERQNVNKYPQRH